MNVNVNVNVNDKVTSLVDGEVCGRERKSENTKIKMPESCGRTAKLKGEGQVSLV